MRKEYTTGWKHSSKNDTKFILFGYTGEASGVDTVRQITEKIGCAVGAHAQKTVFKFRDAQARAGDAVTEVCVKPTVVEVKIQEDKGRIKDEWTLSKEEVEIAMKGELDNIRAWGTYLSTIKYNCDVIMGATFKVEDNEKTGGYTVTVVGYPGIFVNWHPATKEDYEWIRLQKLSPTDGKSQIAPVVKNKN